MWHVVKATESRKDEEQEQEHTHIHTRTHTNTHTDTKTAKKIPGSYKRKPKTARRGPITAHCALVFCNAFLNAF